MINVDSITSGYVIDHIKAGWGMKVYTHLGLGGLDKSCGVALIQNVRSTKHGRKDIIKIEGLIGIDMDALGYIDPNITVITVKNEMVADKRQLSLPRLLRGVITCKNPRCITGVEPGLAQEFRLSDPERKIYRCVYCEQEHR